MAVSRDAVEQIAELARIRVPDDEIAELNRRLNEILTMFDQLQNVDTVGVRPMANPLDATQRLRDDKIDETDQRDRFQAIGPSVHDGLYLVPKVIG